jgi:hypothetical protein
LGSRFSLARFSSRGRDIKHRHNLFARILRNPRRDRRVVAALRNSGVRLRSDCRTGASYVMRTQFIRGSQDRAARALGCRLGAGERGLGTEKREATMVAQCIHKLNARLGVKIKIKMASV